MDSDPIFEKENNGQVHGCSEGRGDGRIDEFLVGVQGTGEDTRPDEQKHERRGLDQEQIGKLERFLVKVSDQAQERLCHQDDQAGKEQDQGSAEAEDLADKATDVFVPSPGLGDVRNDDRFDDGRKNVGKEEDNSIRKEKSVRFAGHTEPGRDEEGDEEADSLADGAPSGGGNRISDDGSG